VLEGVDVVIVLLEKSPSNLSVWLSPESTEAALGARCGAMDKKEDWIAFRYTGFFPGPNANVSPGRQR
jgi:hypothetical protein